MAYRLRQNLPSPPPLSSSPTPTEINSCGALLHELQVLWDEIGEDDHDRDKSILQLEQECLNVYRRKVDQCRKYKADLRQYLAEGEAEIATLISIIGDYTPLLRMDKPRGNLKAQVSAMKPMLEDVLHKKKERVKEFSDVQAQINEISAGIVGDIQKSHTCPQVDDKDLSLKRLAELKSQLQDLQKQRETRLHMINAHIRAINELSVVLAIDFKKVISKLHPSLEDPTNSQAKSFSDDTLARLASTVSSLEQEKERRLLKLQNIGTNLLDLWNLLETPAEEQNFFGHVTSLISASPGIVSGKGSLSLDIIEQVELEVERLNVLKASKMKELILRKQSELEQIYRSVHMEIDGHTIQCMLIGLSSSGRADLSELLSTLDNQIAAAKDHAASRKDILDKMEKLTQASEEEGWLADYETDQNRYNAGRGAHKNLKRAEKARILVSKIPLLLEQLKAKVKSWEEEKGEIFLYDKVPIMESLEQYAIQRQHREEEKRRSREQKKLQEQFLAEQEALFGSKRSPMLKKPLGQSTHANMPAGTPTSRRVSTPMGRHGKETSRATAAAAIIPVNYVALSKDE